MNPLIAGLLRPDAYPHPAPAPRLIETHISWVILAGDYAYKLKKPVNLGFLDFSTLEQRRFCCEEELRLNRRLAPHIYLDVVPVTGSEAAPRMGGDGPVREWAVQMRAFPAEATLDREAEITAAQIDAIADAVAAFHQAIPPLPEESEFGRAETVEGPVVENFAQIRALLPLDRGKGQGARGKENLVLDRLEAWSRAEGERLAPRWAERRAGGFIRECHGDLHLGNIAWVDGAPLVFDALEFNPGLRCIDVMSEVAFLTMDLRHRGRDDLAWRFLNRYLETSGDYPGLATLPYYQVYRALVRAKVAAIRASQSDLDLAISPAHHIDSVTPAQAGVQATQLDAGLRRHDVPEGAMSGLTSECLSYLALAERLALARPPRLLLMHGVSGSGKSWLAQHLLERLGAVRLRSDVERKRLFGLAPHADSSGVPGGIYTQAAGMRTLERLREQAEILLTAGFTVIVDATFLARAWRAPFQALAETLGLPWTIVALEAPAELLQARVRQRLATGRDASEADLAVLAAQLEALEPFSDAEQRHVLRLAGAWRVDDVVARLSAAPT